MIDVDAARVAIKPGPVIGWKCQDGEIGPRAIEVRNAGEVGLCAA